MVLEGNKVAENLFFSVTCISVFTCIVRSDYNFAMGLLCYYMIKNTAENKNYSRTCMTVSNIICALTSSYQLLWLNGLTIVLDILWILTMRSIWAGKPSKNATSWKAFDFIRSFTLFLSFVNIILKVSKHRYNLSIICVIGSSHGLFGIDPSWIKKGKSSKRTSTKMINCLIAFKFLLNNQKTFIYYFHFIIIH